MDTAELMGLDWSQTERARLERIATWYTNREGISAMSGQATAQFIIENARSHGRMLEMGCGKGIVTEILAEQFDLDIVEGADKNVRMVRDLLGDRAMIFRSLFEDFEPPHQYDDIVMGRMLGHVLDPQAVLNRAKSWLRADGRIHVVVPNAGSIHRCIGVALGMLKSVYDPSENDLAVGQRRVFCVNTLKKLIETCGLCICPFGIRGTLLKPFSSAQMETYPQELLDAFYEVGQQMPPEFTAELYACCQKIETEVANGR